MISFVIIGRNEAKNLERCIDSIHETISFNCLNEYEIIYVDSKSTDKSIEIAGKFKGIKILKITGYCNAAIGRNIGAFEAKGDILYFIDADMKICKEFVAEVLDAEKKLRFDIVSGIIRDVEDNEIKAQRYNENRNFSSKSSKVLDGGIFLIKKYIWDSVNGMNTKFINGEDGDLGLRLAKKGVHFTRINKTITLHYTINYLNISRIWKMVLNKSVFHCRCVLYRDHLSNKYLYYRIWNNDKTFVLLIFFFIISFIINRKYIWIGILLYLLAVFFRSLKQKRHVSIANFFLYFTIVDLLNIIFLFTFFPKRKKVQYFKIENC